MRLFLFFTLQSYRERLFRGRSHGIQSIELIRQYCVAFYHYDLKMHFKNY